jgi:L-aminopeptidase/D-esterase-like protein
VTEAPLVAGLTIGHAQDREARTGCTVLLGPFRAAVDVRGMATGTRELETLSALHVAPHADAILLTGGSAYGLAAADGVMRWLEAAGRGYPTVAGVVPIVPAAVIYDLAVGRADVRPDAAMGEAACRAASREPPLAGALGAGCGATVGKLLGLAGAMAGGLGTFTASEPAGRVTALAVVNALGDVRDDSGRIIAGARRPDGTFADASTLLRQGAPAAPPPAGSNTTLVAVVTDAPLDRSQLQALARMAATAVARRITPVHTPFDGDVVFAASTAPGPAATNAAALLALGAVTAWAVAQAIERAVASSP